MPAEPRWVSLDAVVAFNREIAEAAGEPHELRDTKALQSAVAHPWNVYVYFMDRDLAVLTAKLYTSVATARAFAAGNKRTAYRAAISFIEQNGHRLDLPAGKQPIVNLLSFFDGKIGQSGVVEWFRWWMTPER